MFKAIDEVTGEAVRLLGACLAGQQVYEIGWSVIPAFKGRGIASVATGQAIAVARLDNKHQFLHAFPSVENPPSNTICGKLGFTLLEECEFEYPRGTFMQVNDWCLDLFATPGSGRATS